MLNAITKLKFKIYCSDPDRVDAIYIPKENAPFNLYEQLCELFHLPFKIGIFKPTHEKAIILQNVNSTEVGDQVFASYRNELKRNANLNSEIGR